jgi:type II secretory pathway component PulJ
MSARVIRRLRAAASDDAGMSLTELLVAMGLSTIIGAMTLGLFVNINNSSSRVTDTVIGTWSVRNAIQAWTADLRVADGPTAGSRLSRIEWLTDNDMLFYADLKNRSMDSIGATSAPTMIWLRRDSANRLVEEQFPSAATSGTAPTVCRILATRLTTSSPVFDGIDSKFRPVSAGTAPTASSGCQSLPVTVPSQQKNPDLNAQASLQNVYAVTIDVTVTDTSGKHPINFQSQAVLPSLGAVG